jgi:hypothetical protein
MSAMGHKRTLANIPPRGGLSEIQSDIFDQSSDSRSLPLPAPPREQASQSRVSGVTLDADVSNFWDSSGTWTGNCRAVCGILALVQVRESPDMGGGLTIWAYGDQDQPKNCQ